VKEIKLTEYRLDNGKKTQVVAISDVCKSFYSLMSEGRKLTYDLLILPQLALRLFTTIILLYFKSIY
jgi:hypothetical protein